MIKKITSFTSIVLLLFSLSFVNATEPECIDNDLDTYDSGFELFTGWAMYSSLCNWDDCNDGNADINPGATENCTDGIDNDCDYLADCLDSDCQTDPACACTDTEVCNDGIDNDCDGKTDCDDKPDCKRDPAC